MELRKKEKDKKQNNRKRMKTNIVEKNEDQNLI
jgi:hypothetical protein